MGSSTWKSSPNSSRLLIRIYHSLISRSSSISSTPTGTKKSPSKSSQLFSLDSAAATTHITDDMQTDNNQRTQSDTSSLVIYPQLHQCRTSSINPPLPHHYLQTSVPKCNKVTLINNYRPFQLAAFLPARKRTKIHLTVRR